MRRALVTVVAAVLLAACGTDPQVREPDPTPSGSATAQPAPSMPAQAREDSDEGRVAFVTHWIDLLNHAAATGDVSGLREISATSCEGCESYIDLYKQTYDSGGFFRNADWSIEDLAVDGEGESAVFVRFESGETRYKASSGAAVEVSDGEISDLMFEVEGPASDRQITSLERLQQ